MLTSFVPYFKDGVLQPDHIPVGKQDASHKKASLIVRKWDGFIIFWEKLRFLVIYRHWRLNVLICV